MVLKPALRGKSSAETGRSGNYSPRLHLKFFNKPVFVAGMSVALAGIG